MTDALSLPHDEGAERVLIGSVLVNSAVWPDVSHVKPADFYSERYRTIWGAVCRLSLRDIASIDPVVLYADLETRDELALAGGSATIGETMIGVPKTSNAKYYAKIVTGHSRRRRVMESASQLQASAGNGAPDVALHRSLTETLAMWNEEEEAVKVEPLWLDQILGEELPEIDWVVEGWLARGDVAVISGDGGVGKSFLALDMALAIVTGGEWLGVPCKRGKVMFIDEENPGSIMRRRVKRLAIGRGLDAEDLEGIPYFSMNRWNLDNLQDLAAVVEAVKEYQPDWIVMDSLCRLHQRDENSNMEMAGYFAEVINTLRGYGCGIIIIHHLTKPSMGSSNAAGYRLRGASEIRNYPEHVISVQREDGALTVEHTKCRIAGEAATRTFKIEDIGSGISLTGGKLETACDTFVIDCLRGASSSGIPRAELQRLWKDEGGAPRTLDRAMNRLAAEGVALKHKDGRALRYYLASEAPAGIR